MKKLWMSIALSCLIGYIFTPYVHPESVAPVAAKGNPVLEDIETLKAINALKLSKEQLKQLVDIVRETLQKRDKTLKEIRAQLVRGYTMDELQDLQDSLNKGTDESITYALSILDENQKRTAELMFAPLPEKEWNEILAFLPKIGQFLSDKRGVDVKLGNKMFSDETLQSLALPAGKFFMELVSYISTQSKEQLAQKFFTQKTLELLKERLNAFK